MLSALFFYRLKSLTRKIEGTKYKVQSSRTSSYRVHHKAGKPLTIAPCTQKILLALRRLIKKAALVQETDLSPERLGLT